MICNIKVYGKVMNYDWHTLHRTTTKL